MFVFYNRTRFRQRRDRNHPIRKTVRAGVATVEMAMIAPFLFLLIFGLVEFSRMMMVQQALTNAAREGCRKASLVTTQDISGPTAVINDAMASVLPNAASTLQTTFTPLITPQMTTGTTITVTVAVDCEDISWFPPMFFAGAQLQSISAMTRE